MARSPDQADVVIIGGGLVGCAIALELARRGISCAVIERDRPGQAASWAGAGMLSPVGELAQQPAFLQIARASLAAYPAFVDLLTEATGVAIEFARCGKLEIAFHPEEFERLERMTRVAGTVPLTAAQALSMAPALSTQCAAAAHLPEDALVDNRALSRALWQAAQTQRVAFRLNTAAHNIETRAGRVVGVRLADSTIATNTVVIAAGAWSAQLDALPRTLAVRPVRGQMIALQCAAPPFDMILESARCYLIPRAGGRVLVGATVEDVGFEVQTTTAGQDLLLAAATELVPALAGATLVDHWAGLRPGTPDDLPILGRDPELDGLIYATGHYRNGILLTPITGTLIADLIEGRAPAFPLDLFRPDRFSR